MDLNKKNMQKICLLILFAISVYWVMNNALVFTNGLAYVISLISPFIIGGAIAFILNAPMKVFEKCLIGLSDKKHMGFLKKCSRMLSIVLSIVLVLLVIAFVFFLVIPELGRAAMIFADNIQPTMEGLQRQAITLLQDYPDLAEKIREIDVDWASLGENVVSFLSVGAGNIVKSTVSVASAVVGVIVNIVLAIIFAIYALSEKEKLCRQAKKILYAFVKKQRADSVLRIARLANRTFSNFMTGQFLEACILGLMFFICMSIFGFPYAMVVSVVITVTALIPMVGAFIGCAFAVILIVMVNPMRALWFVVMFLILQQIEGNIIYPKVVGNSVGLPAIWVLVAITVGGNMMGVLGMILFIPICSVLYSVLRQCVNKKIEERKIQIDRV